MACNGASISITNNETLYALIGTTYGGDGQTAFNLPDLRGRLIVGAQGGQPGPGLSPYPLGAQGGSEQVTLSTPQLPTHQHAFSGSVAAATGGTASNDPAGRLPGSATQSMYAGSGGTAGLTLQAGALTGQTTPAGNSQPHANIQPVLAINYIICTVGMYPPPPQ